MSSEVVSPLKATPRRGAAVVLRPALISFVLVLAAAVAIVVSRGDVGAEGGEKSLGEKRELLAAAANEQKPMMGHYLENGKIHYFQMASSPHPSSPPAEDQSDYRTASGLGLAGGGDPYKYIRSGHYAKILQAENARAQRAVMKGRMQQLSDSMAGSIVKSRDEALLALLSAPVSQAELKLATHGKSMQADSMRNLNRYIKQQVDTFTTPERTKLEALSNSQLLDLKSSIVRFLCRASASASVFALCT